jgi:putative oxidoreductase
MGLSGFLEFFGSLFLLVGLFTRPVAFVLSGFMAVAYFMAHAPQGFYPIVNQGELAVLYCFVFLYFVFAGAGAWSIDAARAHAADPSRRSSLAG